MYRLLRRPAPPQFQSSKQPRVHVPTLPTVFGRARARSHHAQELGLRLQDGPLLPRQVAAAEEHHLEGHLEGGSDVLRASRRCDCQLTPHMFGRRQPPFTCCTARQARLPLFAPPRGQPRAPACRWARTRPGAPLRSRPAGGRAQEPCGASGPRARWFEHCCDMFRPPAKLTYWRGTAATALSISTTTWQVLLEPHRGAVAAARAREARSVWCPESHLAQLLDQPVLLQQRMLPPVPAWY